MKTAVRLLAAGALALAGAAAPASGASPLTCGSVVTTNVTLTAPLTGCVTGLIVGADGITIDLNGYSIEGVGSESADAGIDVTARSGVTVRNGRIQGFAHGVRFNRVTNSRVEKLSIRDTIRGIFLLDTSQPSPFSGIEVVGNTVSGSVNGIVMFGAGAHVVGNTLIDLSDRGDPGTATLPRGVGILCRDTRQPGVLFARNDIARAKFGMFVFFCFSDVVGNVATDNSRDGINRDNSNGLMERNRANSNGGIGIASFDSHGLFLENVTNANGGTGLSIGDSVSSHGPFHTVTGNVANANGGFGIAISLAGVVDGGKNRAHANGAVSQCLGVVCNVFMAER